MPCIRLNGNRDGLERNPSRRSNYLIGKTSFTRCFFSRCICTRMYVCTYTRGDGTWTVRWRITTKINRPSSERENNCEQLATSDESDERHLCSAEAPPMPTALPLMKRQNYLESRISQGCGEARERRAIGGYLLLRTVQSFAIRFSSRGTLSVRFARVFISDIV